MNPGLIVKLRPTGPWRIGPDSGARNRVDAIYHSDSLYSAVAHAMSRLGTLDEWLDATARAATPAVCFSSCFPFVQETPFVTPPRTVWPPNAASLTSGRVRWKSARFVPLNIVRDILSGKTLDENRWTLDGPSGCLMPSGKPGPFRTSQRWSAAIDRLSGAAERHSAACLEFRPGAGLWTVVSFAAESARDKWQDRVKAAFRWLSDSGFGGERSRGWGRAEAPEFVEGMLPEMILGGGSRGSGGGQARGPDLPSPVQEPPQVPGIGDLGSGAGGAQGPDVASPVQEPPQEVPPVREPPTGNPDLNPPAPNPDPELPPPLPDVAEQIAEPRSQTGVSAPSSNLPLIVKKPAPGPQALEIEDALETSPDTELVTEPPTPSPESEAPQEPSAPSHDAELEAEPSVSSPDPRPLTADPQSSDAPSHDAELQAEPLAPSPDPRPLAPAPQLAAPQLSRPQSVAPQWLLSLFSPASADSVEWSRGNYTLVERGGRIESPAASGALKKQVQMVSEGSVLYAGGALCGAAPDVAPEGFAHPVFRAGFALAIPLPEAS